MQGDVSIKVGVGRTGNNRYLVAERFESSTQILKGNPLPTGERRRTIAQQRYPKWLDVGSDWIFKRGQGLPDWMDGCVNVEIPTDWKPSSVAVDRPMGRIRFANYYPPTIHCAPSKRWNGSMSETAFKGIILAGGSGTRLHPLTSTVSKQLMPVYDKPMVYYPLATLMRAGIRDILIITTPQDQAAFKALLGDGQQWGLNLSYTMQPSPDGLAQAFILGEDFVGNNPVALVLGDNIFYSNKLSQLLQKSTNPDGGIVFAYHVNDPERYGVVEFDSDLNAISIEEKPQNPKSNYAVPGLYFYDNSVIEVAKNLKPSARGEYEITDVNKHYLNEGKLKVGVFSRGTAWLDTGTFASLTQASQFVEVVQERQGLKIGCIEEIAYKNGFITNDQLRKIAEPLEKSGYGEYLLDLVNKNSSINL